MDGALYLRVRAAWLAGYGAALDAAGGDPSSAPVRV
jgi:hypothetical protein